MDAGVPVKAHVAGIAMGLIKEGNRFAVLSDILGDEDHLGDMDFKVAGTDKGVTALQMDLKIESINKGIMKVALEQAREARLSILDIMKRAIEGSRTELSTYAPRIIKIKINPDKIRDVIGKGGVVIRGIQEETGTTIEIEDDGTISIACVSAEGGEAAKKKIQELTADVEVGKIYEGPVLRLLDFGAIVQLLPGRDGLLHISQISQERVNAVSDHLKEGQVVKVKVIEADDKGRVPLHEGRAGPGEGEAGELDDGSGNRALTPISGLTRDLTLAQLVERLAVDAERRGRPRLEALQPDLDAAAVAIPVLVRVDARDGLVDLLDELALAIAVAQLQSHVRFLARAVVGIGEHRGLVLHRVYGAIDLLRELGLERLENLAEMRALAGVHVLLALLRGVRRETFAG